MGPQQASDASGEQETAEIEVVNVFVQFVREYED